MIVEVDLVKITMLMVLVIFGGGGIVQSISPLFISPLDTKIFSYDNLSFCTLIFLTCYILLLKINNKLSILTIAVYSICAASFIYSYLTGHMLSTITPVIVIACSAISFYIDRTAKRSAPD